MAKPPPLPGRRKTGPPPLPAAGEDPNDWIAPLKEMGLEDNPDFPAMAGLNLRGTVDGHVVKIHASRRSRTRYAGEIRYRNYHGHRIVIEVATPVMTRCAISHPANALERWAARTNRWFGATEVLEKGEACDFLTIWATEPGWAESFLKRPDVIDRLCTLLPESELPPNVGLKWWPGFLSYSQRIDINQVNAEKMTRWVGSLIELAAFAEASPPAVEVSLNRWEVWSLKRPFFAGCAVVGALFAAFILLGLVFTAALIGLAFVMSR
ncbi:MAG: hypothetical protein P1U68_09340 [Verrucomicrobiales bacterium]|nr:hypothetical protein [Verrucomicrobiales bacterium]